MKIVRKKIEELCFDPNNANMHDDKSIEAIKGSLAKFKQQKPVVINEDNVVIAGNGTLRAAKALKWDHLDCVVTTLKDFQAMAYALADNQTSKLADFDVEILNAQIDLIGENDLDIDFSDFGFELPDLDGGGSEGLTDDDAVPEVDDNPYGVKRGDIWQLGEHRVMCGDSTSEEDVGKLMDGEKADMVFTDPPYGINAVAKDDGRVGGRSEIAKAGSYKQVIGDDDEFSVKFILNYSDNIFLFGGNYFAHELPRSTHWLVWNKHTNTDIERQFDSSDCELIWTNSSRTNVSQYTFGWSGMFRSGNKKDELKTRVHPTQKPVGLLEEILKTYKYNLVLDLFLGSGSTLIACEKTNRKCYGMEIDEHYCSVIIKRWEDFTGKKAIKSDSIKKD